MAENAQEDALRERREELRALEDSAENDLGSVPSYEDTVNFIETLHETWTGSIITGDHAAVTDSFGQFTMNTSLDWGCQRLGIQNFVWSDFDEKFSQELNYFRRLEHCKVVHGIDGMIHGKFVEAAASFFSFRDMVLSVGRFCVNACPQDEHARQLMAPDEASKLEENNENMFHYSTKGKTPYQLLFLYIRRVLECFEYKRASGKYFRRIMLTFVTGGEWRRCDRPPDSGVEVMNAALSERLGECSEKVCHIPANECMELNVKDVTSSSFIRSSDGSFFTAVETEQQAMAYRADVEIKDLVFAYTAYHKNFQAWEWATACNTNVSNLIADLTEKPILETPDLKEKDHLRSYGGDAHGNGAGVYDCGSDMFYPYNCIDLWDKMATSVQAKRSRMIHRAYKVHRVHKYRKYTCVAPKQADACVVHLDCSFPYDIYSEVQSIDPDRLYLKWVEVRHFECRFRVCHYISANLNENYPNDGPRLGEFLAESDPIGSEKPRNRISINTNTWDAFEFHPHFVDSINAFSYVTHTVGDTVRYFRVHTGHMWFDCETPEIDQIFEDQKFTEHDCFMLYAVNGRIFFAVGERDSYEGTIFYEGIGGSGKSTMIKIYQRFWPAHLRGILSSNMQSQFGMSSVAHGKVAWCSEISEYPNMPQEEWQDATGGGSLSLSRKNKEPLVVEAWPAQFVWAGNTFPIGYKNGQYQVSRRLYAIKFGVKPKNRDAELEGRIVSSLGAVQRRSILAYDDWLLQEGSSDPNSRPSELPPGFKQYQEEVVNKFDPFFAFLCDPTFLTRVDILQQPTDNYTPLNVVKGLFTEYCNKNHIKKERWDPRIYQNPINENGLSMSYNDTKTWEGVLVTDDFVIGIVPTDRS